MNQADAFVAAVTASAIVRAIQGGHGGVAEVVALAYRFAIMHDIDVISAAVEARGDGDVGDMADAYLDWQFERHDAERPVWFDHD